jgi:hypothetical protein
VGPAERKVERAVTDLKIDVDEEEEEKEEEEEEEQNDCLVGQRSI